MISPKNVRAETVRCAIWKLCRRLNCLGGMIGHTANRAGHFTVFLALLTGMVARADLIFQESCDLTSGATRTLPATSSIQAENVFTNGSGSYLNATASAGSGTITVATYIPASSSNSWAALLGVPINIGGIHYLNLNGAFEVFVRPKYTESGAAWFRPVDVVYGGPLRIIFNGSSSGKLQLEVVTSATALGSAPGAFTAVNTWALADTIASIPNPFTTGAVTHLGVTFKTDSASGQITMKVFGAAGTGAMDTTSGTVGVGNLLAKQSFYANADTIGPNPLPTGAWSMTARPAGATFAAATSVDYDTVRLYNSVPETFPAVTNVPGSVPAPDWRTYTARRDWLMGLGWPRPNRDAKYGMAANLATFYNYPAGSALSDVAVSYTTNNLAQLQTTADLGLSDLYPLGVVRAIYQFGNRFTAGHLSRIGTDAQRMFYWYGGGTENMNLMRLSNGYLLAQMFPTNANVWSTDRSGSAKVNSATLMAHNKESLRQEGQARYQRSCFEANSPNYLLIHMIPMEQLYEFAQDPEVKRIAEAMLAQMMAQLSANVYRGYIMDPYSRFYNSCFTNGGTGPGADDGNKNNVLLLNWLYWNQGIPEPVRFTGALADNSYLVYAALSVYHPLPTFERIANVSSDHVGKAHWVRTSEPSSQDGSALIPHADRRRVWRDREFAMSSVVGYFNPNGYYFQSSSRLGIAYRSNDRLNYLQAGHPYWLADASGLAWWQASDSPFMQVAHHQNTAIVMFNIPPADPWPTTPASRPEYFTTDRTIGQIRRSEHWNSLRTECGIRWPISMDEMRQTNNADGTTWYFLREGGTYIGIRTLTTAGASQQDTFWQSVYATAAVQGGRSQTGFVIEIGTSTATGGQFASFDAFQSALTPKTPVVTWGSGTTPSLFVQYTNSQNLVLSASYDTNLTSDVDGKVHMFPAVSENGVPDLSDPWPDLDVRLDDTNPMATMTNSVLTITDPATGGLVEQVDWTGNLPVLTLGPPMFLPPALCNGQITLDWTGGGTLQWAPAVQGPWTSLPLAVSPYTESQVPTNRFFRFQ